MNRLAIFCVTLAVGLFSATAAEAQFNPNLAVSAKVKNSKLLEAITIPQRGSEYRIMVAQPVPESLWVLEYRYIETSYQNGSDWRVYSRAEDRDDLQPGALWLTLHLVVEIRITETHPEPDYEHVDTVYSRTAANREVQFWRDSGFWAYYLARRVPVVRR